MGKIVIISSAFFESSLPLAKFLSKDSDVTFIALLSVRFKTPPSFDLNRIEIKENKLSSFIDLDINDHYLKDYLNNVFINLKIMLFGNSFLKNLKSTYLLANYIKNNRPDTIHLIGSSYYFLPLNLFLWSHKIVHSFHEIEISRISQHKRDLKKIISSIYLKVLLKVSISKKSKIILFSKNNFLKLTPIKIFIFK